MIYLVIDARRVEFGNGTVSIYHTGSGTELKVDRIEIFPIELANIVVEILSRESSVVFLDENFLINVPASGSLKSGHKPEKILSIASEWSDCIST